MFRPVIVGKDISPVVRQSSGDELNGLWPVGGRYWTLETYYLYTLLWDPFVLHRTGQAPEMYDDRAGTLAANAGGRIALIFAHDAVVADQSLINDARASGGCVVLQQPDPELLHSIDVATVADRKRPCLTSLRERWHLGTHASRPYYYPDQQPYLRLVPGRSSKVLSHIGGNVDLVLSERAAVWAGNAFSASVNYTNLPGVLSQLLTDLAGLLTQVFTHFSGERLDESAVPRSNEVVELQRDFHSLGFAYLTVQELARCYGRDSLDLREVESIALDASTRLVNGDIESAQHRLGDAFKSLETINRLELQPRPAVFTDTLHGGELYPDIGYFEIDWPQHPADVIQTYLRWAQTRSYRFNVDFGATTVREMALRFPGMFAELKTAQDERLVEFVNGSCNQPYPPMHSLESQIRQFEVGQRVWKEVFGTPPRTYASQEFGFCPQLASVLSQFGYHQAVVRVQNMGDAPTVHNAEQIRWIAPSGDSIRALPSHPHKSEQLNGFTYNNLHLKIYLHQRQSPPELPAVFTCLGDITYHRPMREELARVCHYAPIFGSFQTFSGYFESTRNSSSLARRLHMRDFDCDAGILNIERWSIYAECTGNFNTNCMRSLSASNLFAAAEFLDGIAVSLGGQPSGVVNHDSIWEALTLYQGHGTYIVPRYPSGAFLGGIGSPRTKEAGRGTPNVTEYLGPFSPKLMKDVTGPLMDSAERSAEDLIQQRLHALVPAGSFGEGLAVFNFAPARSKVVSLPDLECRTVCLDGTSVPTQSNGKERLALLQLPSYGVVSLELRHGDISAENVADPVSIGDDYLENQSLRVEFDLKTGCIRRLFCKITRRQLLDEQSHAFYCPGSQQPRCVAARPVAAGPLRGCFEFEIELPIPYQQPCRLRARASLDTLQSVVDFETEVLAVPELRGNQWKNHLGVRFVPADCKTQVQTAHFNVLEPHPGERLFSPNVLHALGDLSSLVFLNEGNEFYVRHGGAISNILVVQNEEGCRFRYAVGRADRNPLMQARKWQQPVSMGLVAAAGDRTAAALPVEVKRLTSQSISFVSFDSAEVELLSCRMIGDALRLRIANTSDHHVLARLSAALPIAAAERTSFSGSEVVVLPIENGQTSLSLRPWDVLQLNVRLHARHSISSRRSTRKADALQSIQA